MKNVEMKVDGNILTVTVDLSQEFGLSKSGKTTVISSSEGNKSLPAPYEHIKMGLNVYKKDKQD